MNQQESKAKYDWSNVPSWMQWIATDRLGVGGFAVKPSYSSFLQGWTSYGQGGSACLVLTAPDCAFKDSLEQRPSPCAQCPNAGHKTCCCEVR